MQRRRHYILQPKLALSNHHPSPFEIDGVTYSGVEQFYFAQMATKCHDEKVLAAVMDTSDPALQKDASKQIRKKTTYFTAWLGLRIPTMKEGVRQKFLQNPHLADFLKQTGDSTLAEAAPNDSFWGIGLGMSNNKRSDNTKWGHNNLGLVLEQIRAELD